MRNGDIARLDDLIHTNMRFNMPNGQTVSKEEDLNAYRSGDMKIDEITPHDSRIELIGDNAVVTGTVKILGSFTHSPINGQFRFLRVWKFVKGKWQIIAGSNLELLT